MSNTQATHPYLVGENYFIQTVTFHYTGKLLAVYDQELVLGNAAWIADDGRLTDAMKTGDFNEVEVYPIQHPVVIGRGALILGVPVSFPLPQKQK